MRLKRIDVFRLIAIYLVVWAHCQYFDGINIKSIVTQGLETGVTLVARFTMQFFFIVSGYFVGGKIAEDPFHAKALAWKYTRNLVTVFLGWCLVYAIENPQKVMELAKKEPLQLLFEGTRIHLWFLVSLAMTIWIFVLWPWSRRGKSFLFFGIILYLLGLLGGSYQVTPIGLNLDFNTRNGVFFSLLFFAIGVLIRVETWQPHPSLAWGLTLFGFTLFAFEAWFLWANWSVRPIRHDFLFGSIPYGIGAFFVAYTAKRETKLDNFLAPYSQYVLGIYVSHLLILDILKPLGNFVNPIVWIFIFPVLVFGASLVAVILLSKTPLRRFVR